MMTTRVVVSASVVTASDVGFFRLKLLQTSDQIRRAGPRDHHPTQLTQTLAQIGLLGLAHQLASEAIVAARNERGGDLDVEIAAIDPGFDSLPKQGLRFTLRVGCEVLDQMLVVRRAPTFEGDTHQGAVLPDELEHGQVSLEPQREGLLEPLVEPGQAAAGCLLQVRLQVREHVLQAAP